MIYRPVENTATSDSDSLNQKSIYTRGLWDASVAELMTFFTSSTQNVTSNDYYYEIWSSSSLECSDEQMFSVAYAHISGSGSANVGGNSNDTPSRAIFSQYKLSCLDGDEEGFVIHGSNGYKKTLTDFYVININRSKIGDKLDPGNFEINLAELSGSGKSNNVHTGSNVQVNSSNKVMTFIDNSQDLYNDVTCAGLIETSYHLVSGSLNDGIHTTGTGTPETNTNFTSYGIVYPNSGLVILDPSKLNEYLSFNTVTGSNINGDNAYKLFTSISGAADIGHKIKARNVEHKTTNHYFIRVGSVMANYTNNPTYVIDNGTLSTTGTIKNECFKTDPITYITTVGLYNNSRDLLAIAKLSKPIMKTQNTDLLIKIRLNW